MSRVQRTPWWIVLCVIALAPALRGLRVQAMDAYLGSRTYESVYYLPEPQWLQVGSLGYREAAAGVVWMRALVYFGDEMFQRGRLEYIFRYADALLALDPDFAAVYRWAALVSTYNTRGATLDEMWQAVRYLEQGVARFPNDGRMVWDLGALLSFEIAPLLADPAEKEAVKARGTEHMVTAARLGAAPPWMALSNAKNLQKLGKLEQAVRHLEEMYAIVQDPDTREQIARQLASMRSEAHAEALRRTYEDLEEKRRRFYPYLPADFFLLVGARPVVDEARLLRSGFLPDDASAAFGPLE